MKFLRFLVIQLIIFLISSAAAWDVHFRHWHGPALGIGITLTLLNIIALFKKSQ